MHSTLQKAFSNALEGVASKTVSEGKPKDITVQHLCKKTKYFLIHLAKKCHMQKLRGFSWTCISAPPSPIQFHWYGPVYIRLLELFPLFSTYSYSEKKMDFLHPWSGGKYCFLRTKSETVRELFSKSVYEPWLCTSLCADSSLEWHRPTTVFFSLHVADQLYTFQYGLRRIDSLDTFFLNFSV